ncbi:sensor histidine kinase [Cellulomonas bogoriensis]|uniref:histidine kinase n=1 Tax=Cellulomonas bogoriensis 69B4 = DSM 16987 TaxID=1386082 RepID=A0A0A0C0V0_9CELL|nr:HAMP domain-containing sensor histidine kinase [Cellulomonas bogoriensis]KGM14233.1 hypothetical protein N869_01400 [Cellulomonas bogoriensis 69B4 = DSM 16987]
MRSRLVTVFVAMAVGLVLLFAVPLAYVLSVAATHEAVTQTERTASLVAAALAERESGPGDVTTQYLATLLRPGEGATYIAPTGAITQVGHDAIGHQAEVVLTRTVRGGGVVTIVRSGVDVDRAVLDLVQPLVLTALGLVVVAALAGGLLAKRVAQPFQDLAEDADRLGHGDFDLTVRPTGLPEVDAIGTALTASATRLKDQLEREREFAVTASHELRTPITALRLEIEDVTLRPGTPPDVVEDLRRALGELDRLSAAVTGVLERARDQRTEGLADVDLTALVDEVARAVNADPDPGARPLTTLTGRRVHARVVPAVATQVLERLIRHATTHGDEPVTIAVQERDGRVEVQVQHAGPAATDVLPEVRTLAESTGGRLTVAPSRTATFVLSLPCATGRPTPGPT